MNSARVLLGGAAVMALLATGCGTSQTPLPKPSAAASTSPAAAPTCTTTPADLASYSPSKAGGANVDRITRSGVLRVGVSWDTKLMASRNAQTNAIEGFDIDVADVIAKSLGVKPQLIVISAADRLPMLEHKQLDVVVRSFTINCSRWQDIAFSGEYYDAGQKVLVRKDLAASYRGPQDLAGKNVCAPIGTTSLDNIRKIEPKAHAVSAPTHTGCLLDFQQGKADAITGDDTVLAGLAAQDPYAVVPPGQTPLEDEPYGVGANKEAKDLVRWINAALLEWEQSGGWKRSYDKWLRPDLRVDAKPPTMRFGRS